MHFHASHSGRGSSAGSEPPQPAGAGLEDDFVLMEAIARRDSAALARFYDRHSPVVYSLCLRILRDPGMAEDALVDIFAELWERSERYSAARGTPIAYLLTLTRSRALDRARMKGRKPALSLPENQGEIPAADGATPLQAALIDERRLLIQQALGALDEKYRQVLECAYFEGLSHTEIALKLQRPVGTVKTYLRRGLIQLRELLRSHDESGPG